MLRKTSTSSSIRRTDPAMQPPSASGRSSRAKRATYLACFEPGVSGSLGRRAASGRHAKISQSGPGRHASPARGHQDADRPGDDGRRERGAAPGLAVELYRLHRLALDPDLAPASVAYVGVQSLDVGCHPEQVPHRPDALAEPVGAHDDHVEQTVVRAVWRSEEHTSELQ